MGELTYEDPDRADVAVWLDEHGWQSTAVTSQDEMRRLGRAVLVAAGGGRGMKSVALGAESTTFCGYEEGRR